MERRASEIDSDEASGLERLRVSMVVRGAYVDLRQFIAAVETAPEFLVIEEILLSGGEEAAGLQVLTLGLADVLLGRRGGNHRDGAARCDFRGTVASRATRSSSC